MSKCIFVSLCLYENLTVCIVECASACVCMCACMCIHVYEGVYTFTARGIGAFCGGVTVLADFSYGITASVINSTYGLDGVFIRHDGI